jgi:hypothetical protein
MLEDIFDKPNSDELAFCRRPMITSASDMMAEVKFYGSESVKAKVVISGV